MGNVIQLHAYRSKMKNTSQSKQPKVHREDINDSETLSPEFFYNDRAGERDSETKERIERIKSSVVRINALMKEIGITP